MNEGFKKEELRLNKFTLGEREDELFNLKVDLSDENIIRSFLPLILKIK